MAAEGSGGEPHADSAWMPRDPVPPPPGTAGETVPGYTDLVEIGRGGESVVYRARDARLNREVAIKVLLVDDATTVSRFQREVEITVSLGRQHPNIMTVLATGTTASGRPAIVMDYYERGSLDHRLHAQGPVPAPEVVAIGTVLADALSFAHAHGVLHRDVKPQNVMVLPTSYVLGDFGIARLAGSEHTASAERFTYRHASPQILDGHAPTVADDVWSLGSTMFTLLDGRPPFASDDPDDDTALAYLRRARTEPHRQLAVTDANAGLVAVVERALHKDPAERWPDAAAMRDALEDLRASLRAWAPESSARDATHERAAVAVPAAVPADRPVDQPVDLVEPGPVALSVLSHAPQPSAGAPGRGLDLDRDAAPTAHGLGGDPGAEVLPGTDADADQPRRGKRRLALTLGIVAAVVGITLGIVGQALRDDGNGDGGRDGAAPPVGSGGTNDIPTLDPGDAGKVQPPKFNPAISPVLTNFADDGTTVTLTWGDRTGGQVRFNVVQTRPTRAIVKVLLDPGTTSYTITGVDPDVTDLCYTVIAVSLDGEQAAAKAPRCRS